MIQLGVHRDCIYPLTLARNSRFVSPTDVNAKSKHILTEILKHPLRVAHPIQEPIMHRHLKRESVAITIKSAFVSLVFRVATFYFPKNMALTKPLTVWLDQQHPSFLKNEALHDLLSIIKGIRNGMVYGAKIRFPHAFVSFNFWFVRLTSY
jgi:hypothetical protein